ncbi:putative endonuclease lcl3 [Stygiomarasmius scandens]|uniref:Endonuclease lcl3 n=1 Tax=Marasmiellus scandens TaxID=2682957 RepID=A0ABR1IRG0_9AGAR
MPTFSKEENLERLSNPFFQFAFWFAAGGFVICSAHARYFQRIQNSNWITPQIFAQKRWIQGVVTDVGDADNFRLYHTPSPFTRVPCDPKELKDQTIHIRMAGIDAPEAGQPSAGESLAWLKKRLLGKTIYCQPLRRDRYSRTVSNVATQRTFSSKMTDVCLEMLKAGWAVTYDQHGAEYGPGGKEVYLKAETKAKAKRKGMWAKGADIETPAEYKRRRYTKTDSDIELPSDAKSGSTKAKKTVTKESKSQKLVL